MNVALSTIELFAGVGMLGEGLRAGLEYLGIETRAIAYAEREAYAAAVLAARIEEKSLAPAPIWTDITTFPARQFAGKVDGIVAGFPCQDISVAGQRKGLDGKRSGLFFEIPRIADDCGAWFLFLENVAGISSATSTVVDEAEGELFERAAARVVGELADLGWDAEWIVVSARDVGASHGRARWFCLAWRSELAHTTIIGREARSGFNGAEAALVRARECIVGAFDQRSTLADTKRDSDRGEVDTPNRWQSQGDRSTNRIGRRSGTPLADASGARSQRHKQRATHEPDGRTDARTMPINYQTLS